MSVKTLTPILFGSNQPYYFDQDTKTLPELCALLHGKMNETIEAFNALETDVKNETGAFILKAKEEMKLHDAALRQEFQDFIDTVDIKLASMENTLQNVYNGLMDLGIRVAALETQLSALGIAEEETF